MAQITQQGAPLNLIGISGGPFSLTIDVTATDQNNNPVPWGDFTNPTVVMEAAFGSQPSGVGPTVTSPQTGQLVIAWTAAQTAAMLNGTWALQVTINGTGPLVILAGALQMVDPTVPGASNSTTTDLSVAVGGDTIALSIQLGSVGSGGGGGGAVSSVFGRTGAVVAQSGDYTVGQVTGAGALGGPVFDPRSFGAHFDGVTDDTSAWQSANNAAAAAGGGVLPLPMVRSLIAGQVTLSDGVTIQGTVLGPFDVGSSPAASVIAPTFLITNTTTPAFVMATRDSAIQDVLFHYPNQVLPTAATPTAYPFTIQMPIGSAGNHVRRITMTNAYNGIQIQGGRHIIEDWLAGCYNLAFSLDESEDRVHISRLVASPFWDNADALAYPQTIDTWVASNRQVGTIGRADGSVLSDIFAFVGNVGITMTDSSDAGLNPRQSYGDGSNWRFDTFTTGVACQSTQAAGWQITNFSAGTSGPPITMPTGGLALPSLVVRSGSFWGANKTPTNAAGGGLNVEGVQNYHPFLSELGYITQGFGGATAATRWVGAIASGTPTGGPFQVGDWVTVQSGSFAVCTVAGSPGTWVSMAPLASPAFTGTPTAPTPATNDNSTTIATTAFVQAVTAAAQAGLDVKPSVTVVATGNVATLSGLTTSIDGVTLNTAGMRVLLVAQTTTSQNGIWQVAAGAWTRPTDYASGSSQLGAFTFVEAGTNFAGAGWVLAGDTTIIVDTSAETWTQFLSSVVAGTGLTRSGNTLSITAIGSATGPLGTAARTPSVTTNAEGQVTALTDQAIQITESQVTSLTSDLAARLVAANNLSDVADDGSSRFNLEMPVVSAVAAVATSNVSLSAPGATIDGYSFVTNDEVLLTQQTTPSQNGIWTWNGASSALTRPHEFPSGGVVKRGRIVQVVNGAVNANTVWLLASTAAGLTIDTTAQTWQLVNNTVAASLPSGMSFLSSANALPAGAPANTRRVGATLTSGDGLASVTTFTDTNLRVSFILPVTPTRFRFKWTNQNASFGGSPTGGGNGAMTFTGIYVGQANIPASAPPNQWNGDFLSAPTQIDAGGTFGSAGTPAIYTTAWFNNNSAQVIKARQLQVASIGWTNSGTSLTLGSTQAFIAQGTGCSTDVGTAAWNAHAGTVSFESVGSWCIEYEFVGNNPIGLWVGDSIMAGFQGSNPVNPNSILGPSTRYPERVGLRLGHAVENVSALGKSLTGSLSDSEVGNGSFSTDQYYQRIWFDNPANLAAVPTIPDYAVIALGTNDIQRWDNTAAVKSQFQQLVQTLRQGLGIPRIFALTVPPYYPTSGVTWAFSRQLRSNVTGGSSTTVTFEEGPFDAFLAIVDGLSTTVNQSVTINSTNFTGTQNLTLTSASTANTSGGYAQVGGTGGCIIRYAGTSGNNLTGVLFVKGTAVTVTPGTTAIVGANRITIELGFDDNSNWEECYITSLAGSNGVMTLTLALAGTVAHSHAAPVGTGNNCHVIGGVESQRQRLNAWLRMGPPGVDAVIDIGAASEFGNYSVNPTTAATFGSCPPTLDQQHPYFWLTAAGNAHPRSQAWHNYVAGLISPHLVGI